MLQSVQFTVLFRQVLESSLTIVINRSEIKLIDFEIDHLLHALVERESIERLNVLLLAERTLEAIVGHKQIAQILLAQTLTTRQQDRILQQLHAVVAVKQAMELFDFHHVFCLR